MRNTQIHIVVWYVACDVNSFIKLLGGLIDMLSFLFLFFFNVLNPMDSTNTLPLQACLKTAIHFS